MSQVQKFKPVEVPLERFPPEVIARLKVSRSVVIRLDDSGTVGVMRGENVKKQGNEADVESDPVLAKMDEWLADDSGYDEETYPELTNAFQENRRRTGERLPYGE